MDPLAAVGRTTLYASDTVEFLRAYDGRRFGVTVTSPPYNLGKDYGEGAEHDSWAAADYFDWVELWGRLLYDRTEEHGRLCLNVPLDVNLNGNRLFASDMHMSMLAAGWEFQTAVVWDKIVGSNSTAFGSWLSANAPNVMMPVELVLVYNREGWNRQRYPQKAAQAATEITAEQFLEWRTTVWRFPGASAKRADQPAPFPPELPKRCLKLFSFTDDLILDPFVGSGTTCEQAELLGRESIGVDQNAAYLTELAVPRITRARDIREGALVDPAGVRLVNLTLEEAS